LWSFPRNGRAFLRSREQGVVNLIRCPESQDRNLRGGACIKHNFNELSGWPLELGKSLMRLLVRADGHCTKK
jgi:hypothetical protein